MSHNLLSVSKYAPSGPRSTSSTGSTIGSLAKDIQLADGPEDSISDLAWSPVMNYLAVSSWDKKVRIYDVTTKPSGEGKVLMDFDGPVLSCGWSKSPTEFLFPQDGQKVAGAGTDKTARLLDLGANGAAPQQVAVHDQPIKSVLFFQNSISNGPMIVTGSWDRTIKFWDLRQPMPIGTIACKEKVYSMDTRVDRLAIATAERKIHFVDLLRPSEIHETIESPLKTQTRVIKYFTDGTAITIGSIEGRVGINYVEKSRSSENFTFRCHRHNPDPKDKRTFNTYAVNALASHPINPTVCVTAGADGTMHYWDMRHKLRLLQYEDVGGSITATGFNKTGSTLAYAVSYDWSQGYLKNRTDYPTRVMLHPTVDAEITPKSAGRYR